MPVYCRNCGRYGQSKENCLVSCRNCASENHETKECPKEKKCSFARLQVIFIFLAPTGFRKMSRRRSPRHPGINLQIRPRLRRRNNNLEPLQRLRAQQKAILIVFLKVKTGVPALSAGSTIKPQVDSSFYSSIGVQVLLMLYLYILEVRMGF
ncbi:uncharacterized protein [Dendrobates tinctorius]|uniref:uncharacterized protein isoform X4 n=1 Tax=Dendrobates tinctorius TaxID=92724 RepID=UPI003CC94BB2